MEYILPVNIFFIFFFDLRQKFHSNVMDLGSAIYQTEWYRYIRNVQHCILLMIMRSQQPFYLSAFGVMALNLNDFVRLSVFDPKYCT